MTLTPFLHVCMCAWNISLTFSSIKWTAPSAKQCKKCCVYATAASDYHQYHSKPCDWCHLFLLSARICIYTPCAALLLLLLLHRHFYCVFFCLCVRRHQYISNKFVKTICPLGRKLKYAVHPLSQIHLLHALVRWSCCRWLHVANKSSTVLCCCHRCLYYHYCCCCCCCLLHFCALYILTRSLWNTLTI